MPKHFNKLDPAEAERLSLLLEECGEVLQIIGKIQRHGYESYSPYDSHRTHNRGLLEKEIGHIMHAVSRMVEALDISKLEIERLEKVKAKTIVQYLHHQQRETEATHA